MYIEDVMNGLVEYAFDSQERYSDVFDMMETMELIWGIEAAYIIDNFDMQKVFYMVSQQCNKSFTN